MERYKTYGCIQDKVLVQRFLFYFIFFFSQRAPCALLYVCCLAMCTIIQPFCQPPQFCFSSPALHPKRRLSATLPLNKRITKLKYLLVPALSMQPLFFFFCLSVPWSVGSSKAATSRQDVVLKSSEIKQEVYTLETVLELKS